MPHTSYKAFISYKHGASEFFAKDLEAALKSYAKPFLAPPISVFRDEPHLAPGVDLPRLIVEALNASEFLVLLASPQAAQSTWVQDELRHWCGTLQRTEKLIVLLLAGRIATDPVTKTIDWIQTDALPVLLHDYLDRVPYYLDFTAAGYAAGMMLEHPSFKHAVNGITARFRNIDPNEMLGAEVRQHRHNLLLRNAAVGAIAVLGVAAGATAYIADDQRKQAVSRLLASQALQPEISVDTALLTAVAAFDSAPTQEAENALRTLTYSISDVERMLSGAEPLVAAATDAAGEHLAVGGGRGTLAVWRLTDDHPVFEGRFENSATTAGIGFLAASTAVVAASSEGQLCTIDVAKQSQVCVDLSIRPITTMRIGGHPQVIVVHHGVAKFSTIDLSTLEMHTVSLPGSGHDVAVVDWDLSPDAAFAVVGTYDGGVRALDLQTGSAREILPPGSPEIYALRFDSLARRLAITTADKRLRIWTSASGAIDELTCELPAPLRRVAFLGESILGAAADGALYSCNTIGVSSPKRRPGYQKGAITHLLPLDAQRQRYIVVSEDGTALVRSAADSSTAVKTLADPEYSYSRLAFAKDGRTLVAGTDDGRVLTWDLTAADAPTELARQQAMIRGLSVSATTNRAAFGGQDAFVGLVNLDDGTTKLIPVHGAPFDHVMSLAFSPVRDVLAVANAGGLLSLYEAGTREQIGPTQPNGHPNTTCCVTFDRSGELLFSADNDGSLLTRNSSTGAVAGDPQRVHAGIIGAVSATNVAGELLSVGLDGRIVIKDTQQVEPRCELRHPDGSITLVAAHAADAAVFASVSRRSAAVWSSYGACRLLYQVAVPESNLGAVAVNSKGTLVAWSTWNGPISLLEVPGGESLARDGCARIVQLGASVRRLEALLDGRSHPCR